jgi:hypothetical protein
MRLVGVYEADYSGGTYIPLEDSTFIVGSDSGASERLTRGVGELLRALGDARYRSDPVADINSVAYFEPTDDQLADVIEATVQLHSGDSNDISIEVESYLADGTCAHRDLLEGEVGLSAEARRLASDEWSPLNSEVSERLLIGVRLKRFVDTSGWLLKAEHFLARQVLNDPPNEVEPLPCLDPKQPEIRRRASKDSGLEAPRAPSSVLLPCDPGKLQEEVLGIASGLLGSCWVLASESEHLDDGKGSLWVDEWLFTDESQTSLAINPLAWHVLSMIEAACNSYLPDFVRREYEFVFTLGALEDWTPRPEVLIYACGTKHDSRARMEDLPEGLMLWFQIALSEALSLARTLSTMMNLLDNEDDPMPSQVGISAELRDAGFLAKAEEVFDKWWSTPAEEVDSSDPYLLETLNTLQAARASVQRAERRGFRRYIIDTPERCLAPRTQREAASWLRRFLLECDVEVLVSTKAAPFLWFESAEYLYAIKSDRSLSLLPFNPVEIRASDQIAAEMGYDRGELLSRVDDFLFVEGRADQVVIEELYGEELRRQGIEVIPVHGNFKFPGILEAEVFSKYTNARMSILVDNDIAEAVKAIRFNAAARNAALQQRKNPELQQVAGLIETAMRTERIPEVFSIPSFDMFGMLDEGLLKKRFPAFPGHMDARRQWLSARNGSATPNIGRKRFLEKEYAIDLSVDMFRDIARQMKRDGIRPNVLTGILAEISHRSQTGRRDTSVGIPSQRLT